MHVKRCSVVKMCGGEGGIRTPGTVSRTPVFKTGAFNHSATSPSYYSFTTVPDFLRGAAIRPLLVFNRLHPINFPVHGFSRPEPSTTRPPLQPIINKRVD